MLCCFFKQKTAYEMRISDWSSYVFSSDLNINLFRGGARIVGPNAVDVAGSHLTAEKILIASGAKPTIPDVHGVEHGITSNEIFELESLPRSIVIIGGGYIAIEFAGILNSLGSE